MTAGESRTLNLTTYANPTTVTYTLLREGVPSRISRFSINNGMLQINNINKADRGNFTMKAENSQGSNTFNFTIDVRCKY